VHGTSGDGWEQAHETRLFKAVRVALGPVHARRGGVTTVAVHYEGHVPRHGTHGQSAAHQALQASHQCHLARLTPLLLAVQAGRGHLGECHLHTLVGAA
jgi:hypothetical protein